MAQDPRSVHGGRARAALRQSELLHAYVNEIYFGQDGARAIHGFGLASQFYFGKPLAELELHELALLVAVVRGPTYYDPRRHAERALERRNFVLQRMVDEGLASNDAVQDAAEQRSRPRRQQPPQHDAFGVLGPRAPRSSPPTTRATISSAPASSCCRRSTLPASRRGARADDGIEALGKNAAEFEGAVVVTSPHTGEVKALVGGRDASFEGFNRALDARRQIGSLIKPAVYLAALESGRYSLASIIDDAPIVVELDRRNTWTPSNFDDQAHGLVPLVRALAESYNMATVRLGLDVGLEPIADTLQRLGLEQKPTLYPSMLLGALALTPIEVAQIYNTLANGGFRVPLRAVRSVVAEDGELLQRYEIEIAQAADAGAVYALNQALVQVMERGTGRTVRRQLPDDLVVAGKTGTSDDLRDSWFAGFTNDHLIVTWIGADDNRPIGLTGSTGAAKIWAGVLASLEANSYSAPAPDGVDEPWIDYLTGIRPPHVAPTPSRCPCRHRLLPARVRLQRRDGLRRARPLLVRRRRSMTRRCDRRSRAARCSPMSRSPRPARRRRPPSRPAPAPLPRPRRPPRRRAPRPRRTAAAARTPTPRAEPAPPRGRARGAAAKRCERRERRAARAKPRATGGGQLAGRGASLERALRLDPNNPALWLELGELELQTGNARKRRRWRAKRMTLAGRDARLAARAERLLSAAE